MRYCARCLYPENARPTIIFDEEGICSGCRYHESRKKLQINWGERKRMLEEILDEAKKLAKKRGNSHDCIVPVSGGKDSHYQVWLLKKKYGMNPLLVFFNHIYNHASGLRNLENLTAKSGCDLVIYTTGVDAVRKISRHMLETVGDLTWHYHAGIRTVPFQVATAYNIPLIVWGEHGFAELTGLVSLEDFVEFTRWTRKEHDMRGYEPEDIIGKGGITIHDVRPFIYPTDEEIQRTEVRGIYLSNFVYWDAKTNVELMMKEWNFGAVTYQRNRTFNQYAKLDDHANDVHDYLKYLKFGYGRSTDDATTEIRHGRLTREEGKELVKRYDAREPDSLGFYCDFLGITKKKFYDMVTPMRDPKIWKKKNDAWTPLDAVWKHKQSDAEKKACVPLIADRTFSKKNRQLYYNSKNPPKPTGELALDKKNVAFKVL
ncbi:MAG: N-acetyl sugar amidotransferase [Verrucomicrobiota bacterium]